MPSPKGPKPRSELEPAFLFLGGTQATRYPRFMNALHRRGLTALAIDDPFPEGAMGAALDDKCRSLAFDDEVGVLSQVRAWSKDYDIRGVAALIDARCGAASLAAELLGTRHPGLLAARVCPDKFLQRIFLRNFGPASQVIHVEDDGSAATEPTIGFPCVLKPADLHSSLGVERIDGPLDLLEALREHPPGRRLLLERFATGREYSVESFSLDGEIVFSNITEKFEKKDGSHFICEGYFIPPVSLPNEDRSTLLDFDRKILRALDFQTGVSHAEYRVDDDGMPTLVEIAARPPGDGLLQLARLSTGFEAEEAVVALALGERPGGACMERYVGTRYAPDGEGTLSRVELVTPTNTRVFTANPFATPPPLETLQPSDAGGVRQIFLTKLPGTPMNAPRSDLDRCAFFVGDAPSESGILELMKAEIKAVVGTGAGR